MFLRVRAHRLLLTAALLAVLLTTAVLATLAAFSGSIGDAGLRYALRTSNAEAASLVITSHSAGPDKKAADRAALTGARRSFDGLPVSLRSFDRTGPYALPRAVEPAADRKSGDPYLTQLAAVDRSRVRLVSGSWPATGRAGAGGVADVAVPEAAAEQLRLRPGAPPLTLTDRFGGPPLRIRVTGTYRPADLTDPYWQLDELGGRGVRRVSFTTYGPLIADPAVLAGGKVTQGDRSWLATADWSTFTSGRIGSLRTSVKGAQKFLGAQKVFAGDITTRTALPDLLDQSERALLVARSTLLIVSLQLVLLAAYSLLLVARLLSSERVGETQLLMARGASRRRVVALASLEALLLALPAAVAAPLLAGPLTRLLAGQGLLARIGLRVDTGLTASVWLVGVVAALACAAAVVTPALTASTAKAGRARALPAPLRAGADVGLLAVAGVAYWQLDRQTSGSGALSGDRGGSIGIDPLLVVAPALALLAGTVLTLRLLPPAARLAERRAAKGRGLPAALAGWQLSRRPLRGAGPVLLLVLAVAMGMLAIGQGASWDRSQSDQADFQAGAPLRVLGSRTAPFGQGGAYAAVPDVRSAAPAARSAMTLSGNRQATVLALDTRGLDTRGAAGGIGLRADQSDGDAAAQVAALRPATSGAAVGLAIPEDTARVVLPVTVGPGSKDPVQNGTALSVSATVQDRYGMRSTLQLGSVKPDGHTYERTADLAAAANAPEGRPAGPLTLVSLQFDGVRGPLGSDRLRVTVGRIAAYATNGARRTLGAPDSGDWQAKPSANDDPLDPDVVAPRITEALGSSAAAPFHVTFATGENTAQYANPRIVTLRISARTPKAAVPAALATDRFLSSSGAAKGSVIQVPTAGGKIDVRIAGVVRALPTTGPGAGTAGRAPDPASDGGSLLVDLRAVNDVLAGRAADTLQATEWWLYPAPGTAAKVAATLRARGDIDPEQVLVRGETAERLHNDPLGAGPQSALLAVAVVAALLAAVGFGVSTVGALRERSAEFAVLRALGAPRRQLARLLAVEHCLLVGIALAVGLALGAVLTRAVVPLIVLTGQATQPVPDVLVRLPVHSVLLLLAGVAIGPLLIVAALALRRGDPASSLRVQGGE